MIELLTAPTPNGFKVSVMLEETQLPYVVKPIELGALEQKEPWYLGLNPNGRIPVIVDHEAGGFPVFESGAILIYLAEKSGKLLPKDPKGRSLALQWLMFQMGGIGPMQGQAGVFLRYAPEKIPYAIQRYQKETRRLYEVLDRRLAEAPYLAGDYGIADIATYPWVASHTWVELAIDDLKHLSRWMAEVGARPAVQKGMQIPRRAETQNQVASAQKILV